LNRRVKKIYNILDKKPDVILIQNSSEPYIDDNFFYFTGLQKGLFESAIAILYPDGNIDLITTELESESAKKADANILIYRDAKSYKNYLKKCLSSARNVGLNFNRISLKSFLNLNKFFPDINFNDISKPLMKTRLIKDEIEIDLIKKACKITDKVVKEIPHFLNEDMYEFELAAEINYLMQKHGADKAAFDTISSFGKNSAEPHYTHGDTKLKKGDFVLCDFGACFKKYNSDITRTFIFGNASKYQKNMYETVFGANKIGLDMTKAGMNASEVHKEVHSFIEKTEFKGKFIHSTGHSLGLSVHDSDERITSNSQLILEENMVFTIEPGIYIPGFGGVRIEDDVLIKKNGVEILTKSPRTLIEI
jgi:Xaa-Pro dipeptidase